jgi:hypothetical protein
MKSKTRTSGCVFQRDARDARAAVRALRACFHNAGVRKSLKHSKKARGDCRHRRTERLAFKAVPPGCMRDTIHSGGEQLFQLRQFGVQPLQLKQEKVKTSYKNAS